MFNANTDNSLQANYRCGLPELIVAENPICSTTPTHKKAAKNVKFLTFLAAFAHTNKSLCVPMRIKYNISSSSLNS